MPSTHNRRQMHRNLPELSALIFPTQTWHVWETHRTGFLRFRLLWLRPLSQAPTFWRIDFTVRRTCCNKIPNAKYRQISKSITFENCILHRDRERLHIPIHKIWRRIAITLQRWRRCTQLVENYSDYSRDMTKLVKIHIRRMQILTQNSSSANRGIYFIRTERNTLV